MGIHLIRMLKEEARRLLVIFLGLEVLLFLLPTTGRVEGLAAGYWDGVRLRLLSSRYWEIAIGGGVGAILLLVALIAFANHLARLAPPREK